MAARGSSSPESAPVIPPHLPHPVEARNNMSLFILLQRFAPTPFCSNPGVCTVPHACLTCPSALFPLPAMVSRKALTHSLTSLQAFRVSYSVRPPLTCYFMPEPVCPSHTLFLLSHACTSVWIPRTPGLRQGLMC